MVTLCGPNRYLATVRGGAAVIATYAAAYCVTAVPASIGTARGKNHEE